MNVIVHRTVTLFEEIGELSISNELKWYIKMNHLPKFDGLMDEKM